MLRKSVETRDWLHTIEPRTVRAVMKRVVEDIAAIDTTVALLYEDSMSATEHSSDSSRKAHRYLHSIRYSVIVIIRFQLQRFPAPPIELVELHVEPTRFIDRFEHPQVVQRKNRNIFSRWVQQGVYFDWNH